VGAVGMVARGEIRRRWHSIVALTLLVGIVGAVVMAAAAGARRSDSALQRFNAASRSADAQVSVAAVNGTATRAELRAFGRVHGVAAVAVLNALFAVVPGAPNLTATAAAADSKFGTVVDRARVVAGRAADPSVADEITIGEALAAQAHLGVGDHLDIRTYSREQIFSNAEPGPPAGPRVRLRIVGIVRRPLDLGDRGASGGVLVLTPAFNREHFSRAYAKQVGYFLSVLRIRTRHGAPDVPGVVAAARRIFGRSSVSAASPAAVESGGAQNAIDVLTFALWVFATVAALAGFIAIGIVLTREISLMRVDQATLRALGVTRPQRVAMSGPQVLLIGGGGALLAVLGAVAVSPLFPIGVARRADPDVGVHVDWLVFSLGVLALALVVATIAFLAARRATQRSSFDVAPGVPGVPGRRSTIFDLAARAGLRPSVSNGLRMAFQPGRGDTAVPVRSAFLGAVFGVLGVTALLVFASSLSHLVTTPRLYGATWDFKLADANASSGCGRNDYGVSRTRGVADVTAVCFGNMQLDGRPVTGWGFTSVRGTINPEIIAGHAPAGPRQVALGSRTLDALGKTIGDTVRARCNHFCHGANTTLTYRIVGRVVLPTLGLGQQAMADGAAFTGRGYSPLFDQNSFNRYLLGRYTPGVDRAAVDRSIEAIPQFAATQFGSSQPSRPSGPDIPPEVDRLRHVGALPAILGALLGGLALLAVGHALVTAVRRRRRELALLKTLGFDRAQVRATIGWQATTLATVGLIVGIPAGLIVGRLVWRQIADGLGVPATATIPTLAVILTIPAVLALVNLIAYFPAHVAAQTRPAVTLRSE
jgi:ABC-type lipoprotein release transport system permease subunit